MKIKQKIFLIILMITIFISNVSYAASITTQQLETSIQKMFSKNITIVTTIKSDDGDAVTTRKITASNVSIADSQIQITDASTGKSFFISYKIEGDVCKFESNVDLSQVDDLEIDPAILQVMLPVYQATYLELCYLTVADALGTNMSLVDTYYYQKTNGQTGTIQNEVFTYAQATNNNISNITLDVNLTQLAQLDSSKIDSNSYCEVTIEGASLEVIPTPEATATPESTPTPETTPEVTPTPVATPTPKPTKQQQNNTTTTDIPKAGLETDIVIAIFIVGIIGIFFYIKNQENKDII